MRLAILKPDIEKIAAEAWDDFEVNERGCSFESNDADGVLCS